MWCIVSVAVLHTSSNDLCVTHPTSTLRTSSYPTSSYPTTSHFTHLLLPHHLPPYTPPTHHLHLTHLLPHHLSPYTPPPTPPPPTFTHLLLPHHLPPYAPPPTPPPPTLHTSYPTTSHLTHLLLSHHLPPYTPLPTPPPPTLHTSSYPTTSHLTHLLPPYTPPTLHFALSMCTQCRNVTTGALPLPSRPMGGSQTSSTQRQPTLPLCWAQWLCLCVTLASIWPEVLAGLAGRMACGAIR